MIVMQIQKQMLELVKLVDRNLLSCLGLQLKKLQCDFIQNQTSQPQGSTKSPIQVQFLKIISYESRAKKQLLPQINITNN